MNKILNKFSNKNVIHYKKLKKIVRPENTIINVNVDMNINLIVCAIAPELFFLSMFISLNIVPKAMIAFLI